MKEWNDRCLAVTTLDRVVLFGQSIEIACPVRVTTSSDNVTDTAEDMLINIDGIVHDCEATVQRFLSEQEAAEKSLQKLKVSPL